MKIPSLHDTGLIFAAEWGSDLALLRAREQYALGLIDFRAFEHFVRCILEHTTVEGALR